MNERPSSTGLEGENAALPQRVAEQEDARAKLEALCSVIPMFVAFIDRDGILQEQAMEKLLDGIVQHQFHTAIVDVTGVRNVDAESADALLRIARAARLLGAQLMLTGINPDTAQTLVELGVDLTGITTRSTLQSGIAHALARTGTRPATPASAAPTSAARARRDPQGS
ncbi:STAS domain-containing protein [Sorangium sp. So ce296]|uniref:STAS domain-containing protein n=1 Tax=Sorangium sp. So ce296 TaxID=3133296 RepID=UPI003F5E5E5B